MKTTHRVFGDDCDIVGHQVGDRHDNGNGTFLEWTGTTWALVCPECEVPMQNRPSDGVLACPDCGLDYREAMDL